MMKRILSIILPLAALVSLPAFGQTQPHTPSNAGLRLLQSTRQGIVLELTTPQYHLAAESRPAGTVHQLTVPDYAVTQAPGQPQLPLATALLGVPPDVQLELRILHDAAVPVAGHFNLRPAPRPAPLADDFQPGQLVTEPDGATYSTDERYPATPARIADDAWFRDQRLVRVELYPFQYDSARGTLLWHRNLRVEVRFEAPTPSEQRGMWTEEQGRFDPILQESLLNYDSARAWRRQPTNQQTNKPTNQRTNEPSNLPTFQPAPPRYKITVDQDGLYRVTYADLDAAGMDVANVDPRTFHLTSQGQDVAILVAGEADGHFDPGDSVVFYGQRFRGERLAQRYAGAMADWLTLCQDCDLAGIFEKYTDDNVYWLTAGGPAGPRMTTVDGTPTDSAPVPASYRTTVHAEESLRWWTFHFTSEDTWFWERVQTGPSEAVTHTYTTTLTAPATDAVTATVRGEVVGRSYNSTASPDHHTRIYLNDTATLVEDATWDGPIRYRFEGKVPPSALRDGENDLLFSIVNDAALAADDIYFDWFEVEYPRRFEATGDEILFAQDEPGPWQFEIQDFTDPNVQVYDVTAPQNPTRVLNPRVTAADAGYRLAFEADQPAGTRYLAAAEPAVRHPKTITRYTPPDLRSPDNGADYVIITHHQFYDTIQRLADYRAAQGLRVKVVDVEDLYNEFNDGIFHPIAIRNFLAYAYANWQPPAPSYVLLVGDGHWNLKGYNPERYGPVKPIYMPPNLAFIDPWQGEVDSANLLAAVVGDDILPDLAIGRLPVETTDELDAAIDKIIRYEASEPADWRHRTLFVADNIPDSTGNFIQMAEDTITTQLPASFEAGRIYLNDFSCPPSCAGINTAIADDLNQPGALFVTYIGHASIQRWTDEQVFVNDDVALLDNADQLPVILSMTCLDGYWFHPTRTSLVETLVRAPSRGAVSTFSPTGLGVATGHHVMQRRFFDAVLHEGVRTLGPATLAAKLALYETGWNYDLIDTFTIFGDPALRLQLPAANVYLPLIQASSQQAAR